MAKTPWWYCLTQCDPPFEKSWLRPCYYRELNVFLVYGQRTWMSFLDLGAAPTSPHPRIRSCHSQSNVNSASTVTCALSRTARFLPFFHTQGSLGRSYTMRGLATFNDLRSKKLQFVFSFSSLRTCVYGGYTPVTSLQLCCVSVPLSFDTYAYLQSIF